MEKKDAIALVKGIRIRIANDGEYRISDEEAEKIVHDFGFCIEGEQ